MTIFRDALKAAGIGKIKIVEGGVYCLKDKVINFPDSKDGNRTKHDYRVVLVLSNQKLIDSYTCPCVIVAPMSHATHYKSIADIIIEKSSTNGLTYDSRILFGHIQPVLKSDLEKQIGVLSDEEWQRVMQQIVFCFDH
jgi:mRNA-degrading endonuclease toxin of MazEF toxin-antitoxin module